MDEMIRWKSSSLCGAPLLYVLGRLHTFDAIVVFPRRPPPARRSWPMRWPPGSADVVVGVLAKMGAAHVGQ